MMTSLIRLILFTDITLSFEMEQYVTEEGDNVIVCVVLTGQSERDVAVTVSTADGDTEGKL